MSEHLKLLITVKTQPTFSQKYLETVCTAGITEQGEWRRLYPVPFRFLDSNSQYKKYQWIECDVERNPQDDRPESRKLCGVIKTGDSIPTESDWVRRRRIIDNVPVCKSKKALLEKSKDMGMSLCLFKPTRIKRFFYEEDDREWSKEELLAWDNYDKQAQLDLFNNDPQNNKKELAREKLPYKFYYEFEDEDGASMKLSILDWEIAALYWKYFKNETIALEKIAQKYEENFMNSDKYDLHFYLGTRLAAQKQKWKNPWSIIGIAPFPSRSQGLLFP